MNIVGFDGRERSYLVTVIKGGYEQKFYLRADSEKVGYEQRIKEIFTKI